VVFVETSRCLGDAIEIEGIKKMDGVRKSLIVVVGIPALLFVLGCANKKVGHADDGKGQAASKTSPNKGEPKITALEKEFKFGSVKEGTMLEHVFRIRNDGNAELVIEKASGS
jgi:hypothetical protein